MEYLFLMLGKGPKNEKTSDVLDHNYRTANYFLPNEEERGSCETPFVGEALLHLYPGRFREVHIFGTADSMWHTLYRHLVGKSLDQEQESFFLELALEIEQRTFTVSAQTISRLEHEYSCALGVPVTCTILPLPTSDENFWSILQAMVSTKLKRGILSIDITHGLRSHPVFSLLALFFMRTVYPEVSIGSVFYGAYELSEDYKKKTPIFDLKPAVELMNWTEAARAFDRYSDASLIAELLRTSSNGQFNDLAKRAEYLSRILQLNTLGELPANARRFVSLLDRLAEELPPAAALLREQLSRFSSKAAGLNREWEVYLETARYHWDHYRAGLAVLAAWEASLARLGAAYGLRDTGQYETYRKLSRIADGKGIRYTTYPEHLREFNQKMCKLNLFRKGIAHADQDTGLKGFQPNQVYTDFPALLDYLESTLPQTWLDTVPILYPWPHSIPA